MLDLAIDEDGDPFDVPSAVKGWRVRRASGGRGRPALLHEGGKPLVLRVDASHADLLAAAGPGKYRLDPVDEFRRKVDGVPQACTGPLSNDDDDNDGGSGEEDDGDRVLGGNARPPRRMRLEDVVCQLLANQTRMVETTVGQVGAVMAGLAHLLQVVHPGGMTHLIAAPTAPIPVPVPPPPPPQDEEEDDEDELAEDERGEEAIANAGSSAMWSDALRLLIEKAVDRFVPLFVEKVISGEVLSGIPLGALLDWRKAAPGPAASPPAASPAVPTASAPWTATAAASPAPAVPPVPSAQPASAGAPSAWTPATVGPAATAPTATPPVVVPPDVAVPVASAAPIAPGAWSSSPASSEPLAAGPPAQRMTVPPSQTAASAGVAPSPSPHLGAAPAAGSPDTSATSAELTHQSAAAALNAHILQIWRGLSPPERSRASQLITGLGDAERAAWLAELARLSVPDAIARARAALASAPPTAPPAQTSLPPAPKE